MKAKTVLLLVLIGVSSTLVAQNKGSAPDRHNKKNEINKNSMSEMKHGSPAVMLENLSRFGFAETVDKISQAVPGSGWKITTTHDMQETMKKNGKDVLPVKVIEICNPQLAYQILSSEDQKQVSVFLPCRVSVYEKADGKTYISRMNSPAFGSMIGGTAASVITEAFNQAEKLIAPFITE